MVSFFLKTIHWRFTERFHESGNGCAQFVINDKSLITQHPKKMYYDLYHGLCMNSDLNDGVRHNGFEYFMEYLWQPKNVCNFPYFVSPF